MKYTLLALTATTLIIAGCQSTTSSVTITDSSTKTTISFTLPQGWTQQSQTTGDEGITTQYTSTQKQSLELYIGGGLGGACPEGYQTATAGTNQYTYCNESTGSMTQWTQLAVSGINMTAEYTSPTTDTGAITAILQSLTQK